MGKGIVCKVWNIQGSTVTKGATSQLRDSIGYILNDEKTEHKLNMTGCRINDPMSQLGRECRYIENDVKTVSGAYVGGCNLVSTDIKDAVKEMMDVKKFFKKMDGRAALHGIISLPEEQSKIENAPKLMMLCESVMKEIFPDHQVIFAIHTNTENLHVHFIVNSVGLSGKKIHQNNKFMSDVLHPCVNKYAKKFGFTPNEKWKKEDVETYMTYPEIKVMLRKAIDLAVEESNSFDEFIETLRKAGYTVNIGKYISLKNDTFGKAVRTHKLGDNYSKESIVERIATRKDAFNTVLLGKYAMNKTIADITEASTSKMTSYKNMTPENKKRIIAQLKIGRNPWREHSQQSWQLNNIVDQMNRDNRVYKYVQYYSSDNTIQNALDNIIVAKKKISEEKKIITLQKKKYKPILEIYERMKKIERKAYLYEHENVSEYRTEYEEYRGLTRRLRNGYNKEISEVAGFLEECDERLMYAHAQLNELSLEYREIKMFQREKGDNIEPSGRLVDTVGVFANLKEEKMRIFGMDSFYIAAGNSDILIRVIRYPTKNKKGETVNKYEVTVTDVHGNIIHEIDNENGIRQFTEELNDIEKKYGLQNCKRFDSATLASQYMNTIKTFDEQENTQHRVYNEPRANLAQSETNLSFAQAVNHCYNEKGYCVVVDPQNQAYSAVSKKSDGDIQITVYDKAQVKQETIHIPLYSDRNNTGFKIIIDLQKKYGFSDRLITFDEVDKAREYQKMQNDGEMPVGKSKIEWR